MPGEGMFVMGPEVLQDLRSFFAPIIFQKR